MPKNKNAAEEPTEPWNPIDPGADDKETPRPRITDDHLIDSAENIDLEEIDLEDITDPNAEPIDAGQADDGSDLLAGEGDPAQSD